MIPTLEEYKKAKAVTLAYENEQARLIDLKIEAFRVDLTEYFRGNLIDGYERLHEFHLEKAHGLIGHIIPDKPCLEENYNGGNDKDIKALCEKHGVDFTMKYWCYHK